ncbi:MAG: DUF4278 domain-containing protein [Cyanobacteria bacterium J06592_8]
MKLIYRGISYTTDNAAVETTTESKDWGQTYTATQTPTTYTEIYLNKTEIYLNKTGLFLLETSEIMK